MKGSLPAASLTVALAALLPACASDGLPAGFRATALADSPGEFHEVRTAVLKLARLREANDAAAARAMHADVLSAAKSLLTMAPPHDLKRERVPRFLEGRAVFSDAVNAFDRAVRSADDAALWQSTLDLESSFWGWFDAYRGRPSEGAV